MKIFLIAILLSLSGAAYADIAVIVHNTNDVSLEKRKIARVFLGKIKKFPNGQKAVPIAAKGGSAQEAEFNKKVIGKSASQLQAYWSKLVFTGKGTPPQEINSDAEVIELVKSNPNIIGYVDAASVTGDVKVVATF